MKWQKYEAFLCIHEYFRSINILMSKNQHIIPVWFYAAYSTETKCFCEQIHGKKKL